MKRISMCLAALGLALAASGSAYANCNGRGCDTPAPSGGSNTANGGQGTGIGVGVGVGIGQGGQGGAGGRGGEGGSVIGSGNSSNVNANTQGQQQGQAQSSKNSNRNSNANRNDNRSNATGGNSAASNSNSNANSGNNSDQSVTVQGDNYEARRIPVSTAYAPNIMPTAVCMGSSSGGGSTQVVSLTFGTSWTDDNCMLLEQVRTVAAVLNDRETASEMMCDVAAYAAARERAGKPCGNAVKVAQSTGTTATAAQTSAPRSSRYEGTDPIVRARLGLPPLK